jgi:hypothetical protein
LSSVLPDCGYRHSLLAARVSCNPLSDSQKVALREWQA